jgi:endonuclease YncB( thermonuclease family)
LSFFAGEICLLGAFGVEDDIRARLHPSLFECVCVTLLLMRAFQMIRQTGAFCLIGLFFFMSLISAAHSKETLTGPVVATVERIIDGDTIEVVAHIWLGQKVRTAVRIAGIDAPEMRGRCAGERELAMAATDYLKPLEGAHISLHHVTTGKFAGRILADVRHDGFGDVGQALLREGMARPYSARTRIDWCEGLIVTGEPSSD